MRWELWVAVAAMVLAVVAFTVAAVVVMRSRGRTGAAPAGDPGAVERHPSGERLAVVVNPSKDGVEELVEVVRRVCSEAALPEPMFFETTIEDPGEGQARAALEAGADVVVAAGGDGTVRAVAAAMVDTDVPMALLPAGTGNLLARNLDIPVTSVEEAMAVVLAGRDRRIDVGWARILEHAPDEAAEVAQAERVEAVHARQAAGGTRPEGDEPPERPEDGRQGEPPYDPRAEGRPFPGTVEDTAGEKEIFLVIAGLGFDAAMVADADDALKRKVGWMAYFLAGVRHLHGRRMRAQVTLDDRDPVKARLRTILVGNCGRLPGGITLLPDAVIDDGELDVAAVDARGGLAGWAQLFGEVVMQGFGMRTGDVPKIGRIDHTRAKKARIRVEDGEQAQVDGDPIGRARVLETWVDPQALIVRAL
ncbi:diacylglycerol/lipid kinase family protein [Puerhibacterium puerhi]|uniref:diacylglycerol/lipid kinase family protein n=1 Tax=Puerhibacterium puerhi TaxID=2692623 RepID=UPI001357C282|nr:diacylglycerol kinase family protein [Puerhibacterium puerhi]